MTDIKIQYSDLRDYLDDDWQEFLIWHWNLHDNTRPYPEEPLHLEDDFDSEHKKQVECEACLERETAMMAGISGANVPPIAVISAALDSATYNPSRCPDCHGHGVRFVFDFKAGLATFVEYIMEAVE